MSAPAVRSAALNVERSRFGCSARILDFLPILAKNASMGIDGSAVATGAWPVATYKYKAAGRNKKPTSNPSRKLNVGLPGPHPQKIFFQQILNKRRGGTKQIIKSTPPTKLPEPHVEPAYPIPT